MTDIQTQTLDGFIIGGMAPQKLKTKYSKSEDAARASPYKGTYVSDNLSATSASALSQSTGPAKFSETISSGINVAGRVIIINFIFKIRTKFFNFSKNTYPFSSCLI